MAKVSFKPGNILNPVPAVMVSVMDKEGAVNVFTVAWTGTICSDPAMVSISVRPSRYSYHMLEETGEFVINLVTSDLVRACDYCGVKSGRDTDKIKEMGLSLCPVDAVKVPGISESPINIGCRIVDKKDLGTHTMFMAEVVGVNAEDSYMDEKGRLDFEALSLVAYSHGEYFALGKKLGSFGYSVRKDAGKTVRKPVGKSAGKAVGKTVGKSAGKTVGKTVEKSAGKSVRKNKKVK